MRSWPRLLLVCLLLLTGSAPMGRVLPQDAYVWQRHWTPSLTDAMTRSAPLVRGWRVLAAQSDVAGALHRVAVDREALQASNRPVVLVVRLDSHVSLADPSGIAGRLATLVRDWPGPVAGLEVDHDCATAALPAYARLLTVLRHQLNIPLSITMLPTWLGSSAFASVMTPVAEIVLQVHAVQNPRAGLFDPAQARRWIDALARRSDKPFRVALPAYGSRVTWREDGRLLAVESERPLLAGGDDVRELMASPIEVASLLRDLQHDPPARLAGIGWFRLPTDRDVRAWSLSTWHAVMKGNPLPSEVRIATEPSDIPGTSDLLLANDADIDAPLPAIVALPADCAGGDGTNGYTLADTAAGKQLLRQQTGLLRAHHRRTIGWIRCQGEPPHD